MDLTYNWYMAAGQQEIAMWIESLNKIVNGKFIERYRCKMLGLGEDILQLQQNSLEVLKKIRAVVARAYYSGCLLYTSRQGRSFPVETGGRSS